MTIYDIFKSIPAKGAIITDATGPDDGLIFDFQNGIGEKFHFEILNKEQIFSVSNEIKTPSGAGNDKNLRGNIILFMVPR